jgi:hypothetical protein
MDETAKRIKEKIESNRWYTQLNKISTENFLITHYLDKFVDIRDIVKDEEDDWL